MFKEYIHYTIVVLLSMIGCIYTFECRLYGIDDSLIDTQFVEVNSSSSYQPILNLGHSVFSSAATSTKIDNRKYISTYHTFDSLGIPHFFLLIIDIQLKSIELNLTLVEKQGSGSFWQIAVDKDNNDIIGIRESFHSGSNLEVAIINQTTGLMQTIGTYPIGEFSIVMVYASKRRLYYNVMESKLYGINIDTGKLDVNIEIPSNFAIYAIDYDYDNDRLISLVYSSSIGNGWFLAEIIITADRKIHFNRIGKTLIPFGKYLWSTTYTIDIKHRLWITLWGIGNTEKNNFIIFNIDNGQVVQSVETNFVDLSNFVCF